MLIVGLILLRGCGAISNAKSESDSNAKIQSVIDNIEIMLSDKFENYEVNYEDNLITVNIWKEGVTSCVTYAIAGDESCMDAWKQLADAAKVYSLSISDLLESYEITETPVILNVLNDKNTDNVLLSASAGIVLYDYVENSLSEVSESTESPEDSSTPLLLQPEFEPYANSSQHNTYVLNTNTMKFHYSTCSSVDDMDDANKDTYTGTRSEVIAKGYEPCGRCDP